MSNAATSTATTLSPNAIPSPSEIKAHLDQYVIGQEQAKVDLATAAHMHYLTLTCDGLTPEGVPVDRYNQNNLMMIGPSGSGKTHMLQTLARILQVPFLTVKMPSFSQVGYVGDNINGILTELVTKANFDLDLAQRAIVHLDEFDKIAMKSNPGAGLDVAGEGVQKGLLPLLEGSKIRIDIKKSSSPVAKEESVEFDTSGLFFVATGAFSGLERIIEKRVNGQSSAGFTGRIVCREENQKEAYKFFLKVTDKDLIDFGLMIELIGRLPVRTGLLPLTLDQLFAILKEPKNCLVDQYRARLKNRVNLNFTDEALKAIAREAYESETGARALTSVMFDTMQATTYLQPPSKVIKVDDVAKRDERYAKAIAGKAGAKRKSKGGKATVKGAAAAPVLRVGAPPADRAVAAVELALPLPTWEVLRRGRDGAHLRLMRNADRQSFWIIHQALSSTCEHCRRSMEMHVDLFASYKPGVNPYADLGRVPMEWVCQKCDGVTEGFYDMTEADCHWKPED